MTSATDEEFQIPDWLLLALRDVDNAKDEVAKFEALGIAARIAAPYVRAGLVHWRDAFDCLYQRAQKHQLIEIFGEMDINSLIRTNLGDPIMAKPQPPHEENWRDALPPQAKAKVDQYLGGNKNASRPSFEHDEQPAPHRKGRKRKAAAEVEVAVEPDPELDEDEWSEEKRTDFEDLIEALAELFDTSPLDYEQQSARACNTFHTTRKVIDAEVRRFRAAHKPPPEPAEKEKQSQLQRLVQIGRTATLWHDRDGTAFASFTVAGHHEHHLIGGASFKNWLRKTYSEKYPVKLGDQWVPQMPGSAALKESIDALEGHALISGPEHPAAFREGRPQSRHP
jgi:hypothetical protein